MAKNACILFCQVAPSVYFQDLKGFVMNRSKKKVISVLPIYTNAYKCQKVAKNRYVGQKQAQNGPTSPERSQKVARRILGPIWVTTM